MADHQVAARPQKAVGLVCEADFARRLLAERLARAHGLLHGLALRRLACSSMPDVFAAPLQDRVRYKFTQFPLHLRPAALVLIVCVQHLHERSAGGARYVMFASQEEASERHHQTVKFFGVLAGSRGKKKWGLAAAA